MRGETAFRGSEVSSFRQILQVVGLVLISRLICLFASERFINLACTKNWGHVSLLSLR